jgi:hypothetical protein
MLKIEFSHRGYSCDDYYLVRKGTPVKELLKPDVADLSRLYAIAVRLLECNGRRQSCLLKSDM